MIAKSARNMVLFWVLGIVLLGCKSRFTDEEQKWIDAYNVGDTLIFQSERGELDTSYIVDKTIRLAGYNPINDDWYRSLYARVYYKNKNSERVLLKSVKTGTKRRASVFINYLGTMYFYSDGDFHLLEDARKGDVYVLFNDRYKNKNKRRLKCIYWHEEYGIIKYIDYYDISWERINLKVE